MGGASLPPGFRFHPTDEELVGYYLKRKVEALEIELEIIPVIDLYKFDPWELPEKSFLPKRDMEWFFFCPRDRKYPNGSRTNRATKVGYWKATGKDRKIVCRSECVTAYRKTLVFYCGRAPSGDRTDWIMHEYRLSDELVQGSPSFHGGFALCRVAKKNESTQKSIVQQEDSKGKIQETSSRNDEFTPTEPVIKPLVVSNDVFLNESYQDGESRYSTPLTSPAKITPISDFEPILSHSTDPASFWVSPELILDSSKDYPQLQASIPYYFRQYDYPEPMPMWLSYNHTEISPCSSYSNFPVDNELSGDLKRAGYMNLGGAEDIQNGSFYYDHTSTM